MKERFLIPRRVASRLKVGSPEATDLVSSIANQLWRIVSGPVLLLLLPIFLSKEEQGYWFLFASLSALSILADLGFSNIILQFSAHEAENQKSSPDRSLRRLGSLYQFTTRWVVIVSLIAFPVIFSIGCYFLQHDGTLDGLVAPWLSYCVASGLYFILNSQLSFFEGMNFIAKVQMIRLISAVSSTCTIVVSLLVGGHIMSLVVSSIVGSVVLMLMWLFIFGSQTLRLCNSDYRKVHNWAPEVLPLFFRYSISFGSGYFIFQLYTPLMHYFHGPVASGQVGITLSMISAIFTLSNTWVYTITPRLNMAVARSNWKELDSIFWPRLVLAQVTFIALSFCAIGVFFVISHLPSLGSITNRFLPLQAVLIVGTSYLFQLIVTGLAAYLRAHRQEPFMWLSIFTAFWIVLATLFAGRFFGQDLFFLGFLSSYTWGMPLAFWIFLKKRSAWHE